MKKKLFSIIIATTLIFTGCSSTETETNAELNQRTSETEAELESTIVSEAESEPDTTSTTKYEVSELFKSVYLPYANRENTFTFNSVREFIKSTEYDAEITEPTSEDLGTITVTDKNGDSVFFAFVPINGIETIMSVSYYQVSTDSEVVFSNYSSDCSPKYDNYETHVIGETSIEVTGPDEQMSFLFSNS